MSNDGSAEFRCPIAHRFVDSSEGAYGPGARSVSCPQLSVSYKVSSMDVSCQPCNGKTYALEGGKISLCVLLPTCGATTMTPTHPHTHHPPPTTHHPPPPTTHHPPPTTHHPYRQLHLLPPSHLMTHCSPKFPPQFVRQKPVTASPVTSQQSPAWVVPHTLTATMATFDLSRGTTATAIRYRSCVASAGTAATPPLMPPKSALLQTPVQARRLLRTAGFVPAPPAAAPIDTVLVARSASPGSSLVYCPPTVCR